MATSDTDGTSRKTDAGFRSSPVDAERRAQYERVLREALLAANDTDAALLTTEHAAVRSVVARHRAQALTLDPVTIDLVAALLGAAFRVRVEDSPMCIEMSRMIAKSLWSDLVVRDRIDSLWGRLLEQSG